MTQYAKMINGQLEFAQQNQKLPNGSLVFNFTSNLELMHDLGYKPIEETPDPDYPYILTYEEQEDKIVEVKTRDDAAIERMALEEQQRLAQKSLTKREVFLALYDDKGITPEQIRAQISDTRALIEFDYAERYYRGNPLITQLGLVLGYSSEQLDTLFNTGSFTVPVEEPAIENENNETENNENEGNNETGENQDENSIEEQDTENAVIEELPSEEPVEEPSEEPIENNEPEENNGNE